MFNFIVIIKLSKGLLDVQVDLWGSNFDLQIRTQVIAWQWQVLNAELLRTDAVLKLEDYGEMLFINLNVKF